MGNIQGYNHFSQLSQQQLLGTAQRVSVSPDSQKALADAKSTTQKLLATGAVGEAAKQVNGTVLNVEKVSKLASGDVNAVNLKAAVDLGEIVTRGQVQEVLGTVAAPLGAVAAVELMTGRVDATIKDPTADNVKLLLKTSEGAAKSFSTLSKLLVENSGTVVSLAGKVSDDLGRLVGKAVGSSAGTVVKTGLTTSQRVLGGLGSALNVGIAGLDIYIAGTDIKRFWDDPNAKNFTKMGLGLVAATGSVIAASKIPGLSGKAALVAALADVGKVGVDVDWGGVYDGVKTKTVEFAADQSSKFKQDILVSQVPSLSRLPAYAAAPQSMTVTQSLHQLAYAS